MASKPGVRIRDPERRERILAAAAELIARQGYHAVSLGEIGAAAGIVGSGIYRHFDSKVAILVQILDGVVDRLVDDAEAILRASEQPEAALVLLIRGHVAFTLTERAVCEVYLQELRNLPNSDRHRLRWKQRHYVDLWIDLLRLVRPDLPGTQAQLRVHAAISAVHSLLLYHSALETPALTDLMTGVACDTMGLPADLLAEGPPAGHEIPEHEAS